MARKQARKIGIIGVPGSGKTTVTKSLQVEIGSIDFQTAACTEYAREFLSKHGAIEHVAVQQSILFKQIGRENVLSEAADMLFCDSPIYFCYLYAYLYHDKASTQQVKIVRDMYRWAVLNEQDRYDAVIFLPRQFDVVDDGVRDPEATERIESAITGFLNLHKSSFPRYTEIYSDETDPRSILKDRVRKIEKWLADEGLVPTAPVALA